MKKHIFDEPSLYTHFQEIRNDKYPITSEVGLSTIILCGYFNNTSESINILNLHRQLIIDENDHIDSKLKLTGLFVIQVKFSTISTIS